MQRLYKTFISTDDKLVAKVYRDAEYGEFVVKFYRDGVYQVAADYHTDKCDALGTADRFVKGVDCGSLVNGFVIGAGFETAEQRAARTSTALVAAGAGVVDGGGFWEPA